MSRLTIKNTRSKVSPGGVITLPVSARKALGMKPKVGSRVTVAIKGNTVMLAPATADGGFRVSPSGQMEVRGDALKILEGGKARHYYLEVDDETQTVALHPWE